MRTSMRRIRYGSIFLKYPDDTPTSTPMERENRITPAEPVRLVLAPNTTRLKISRPKLSVPKKYVPSGERSLSTGFISWGSKVAIKGAKTAQTASMAITIRPAKAIFLL